MARYALVVGISEYKHLPSPLSKTLGDAEAVANLLRSHGDFQEVTLLNTPKLIKADLFAQLNRLLSEQATGSEVLIYYTGHGVLVEDCGVKQGYLAPSDCKAMKESVTDGIPFVGLNNLIARSPLSSLVMFLDCCHSGVLLQAIAESFTAFNKTDKDYLLISACREFEQAAAMKKEAHSIFTGALLEALSESRQNDEGKINSGSLFGFISDRLKQKQQEPRQLGYGRAMEIVNYRQVAPKKITEDLCPYVGLESFMKETAKFFKGRDRFVRLLLQKIDESSFVPVIGASGSGKSSLVRAGLISALEAQGNWLILPPIKAGDSPLMPVAEISRVLTQLCQRADSKLEISKQIASGNLEAAIACLSEQKNILLVVDQFEEVFTVCPAEKEAERQQFIDLLVGITQHPDSRLRVVTTMRADFFENCLGYRGLGEVIQEHQVLLLPMNEEELKEAIAAPAEVGQYELGEGLLPAILRDVRDEKNVLPLLEFALTQLWEHREKRRFTFEVYDKLGGVMGALNQHANSVFDALKPQEQDWAKRICLMLVRTGLGERDTRQRRTKGELTRLAKDGDLPDFQVALDQLVAGRLLVTGKDGDGEAWVDMAHEALMEKWIYFAKWREEKRDVLRLVNRIRDALDECDRVTDQDKFLLPEGVVAQIEEVEAAIADYLTPEQQEFVQRNRYKYKPWLDKKNLPEMVDIPSGTFWMGSPEGKGNKNEKPYHQVTVKAFRMGKYPVTQAQWRTVAMSPKVEIELSLNPSQFRGEDKPVEKVDWYEAQEFCARLSCLTGENYRLPSEAEWEYACRAGAEAYTEYCFGDDEYQLREYAWYDENSDRKTQPVGQKLPNDWELYDMHGNVWEWCADDWHDSYKGSPTDAQTWTEDITDYEESGATVKLLRGGSWLNHYWICRSAVRVDYIARIQNNSFGFRVVL
ncbi:nSTAND1 domain-containing NTPase [Phormidium tenue]|uniref:SUMF1/EgtB/PvdO family nonheme iron enzyme n=1 Tax=Phormidium tenue FACHB-1050 TaxID=2692857 RepID=A0ABR8CH47_9CYAN|nr:SUMF1/EgtB/PvdO family nonheme iron enzyme [Phormidium tenue]MBD2319690.1 SUMF1/EgtB/PvdO family nonheme iron enzyme [Phormidium tenue FACHB-1050]